MYEQMKGINPSDTVESGLQVGMRGINPTESAESRPYEQMKGKIPLVQPKVAN